jgi:FOG: Ankyrin repeat
MKIRKWHGVRSVLVLLIGLVLTGISYAAGVGADAANAAESKNTDALKTLVKQRADVNAAQPDGTTALHWAAHWNDAEAVSLLLRAGANAKAVNRYGATPLSEAVVSGNAAMIEALLNAGASPKTLTSENDETVLMTAARAGNVDAVRILLDRGAEVNARETYKGQTALMWAASESHPEVVKLLMAHGADWKVRSIDRETKPPRLSAASSISPIARGGFTALLFSAREGDIESAKACSMAGPISTTAISTTRRSGRRHHEQAVQLREIPAGSRRGCERCGCGRANRALRHRRYP